LAVGVPRVGVAPRHLEAARPARNAAAAARARALVRQGDRARLCAPEPRSRPAARGALRARSRAPLRRVAAARSRRAAGRPRRGCGGGARHDGCRMKTLRYFLACYPARCVAAFVWLLVAGATDGLGISTLLPLISVATGSGVATTGYEGRVARVLSTLGIPL